MTRFIYLSLLFFSIQGCTQSVLHPAGNFKFASEPKTSKTNMIAEWDFIPGYGQWAFNRIGGNFINNNLIGFSERDFNGYGTFCLPIGKAQAVVTTSFANNRNGLPTAARLTTTAGAAHDGGTGFVPGVYSVYTIPAGTYTMSVDVKSNTGASQSIRMESPTNVSQSGDMTVTTSWNRLSFTVTSTGSSQTYQFIENGSGGTSLDILFDAIQIEAGGSAGAYVVPNFDFFFGMSGLVEALDPIWLPGKGISCTDQGANALSSAGATASSFTVYTIGKLNSNSSQQAYFISEDYADKKFSAIWGDSIENGFPPTFIFSGTTLTSKIADLADNRVHMITGTYDGTNLKFYIDTVLLETVNAPALSSINIQRLMLATMSLVGNVSFDGEIYYASMYSAAHNQATIDNNFMVLQQLLSVRGVALIGMKKIVLFDGDSISDIPSNGLFPRFAMRLLPAASRTQGTDIAVVGSKVSDLVSRAPKLDSFYDAKKTKNILSILIGANDLTGGGTTAAQFVADLKSYCLARKAVGWKVILCTLLPNTNAGFNGRRNTANGLIHADNSFYDVLADFAADPTMGPDAAASNATYYPDGVHPSVAGHLILAPIEEAAVLSLL